MEQKSRKVYIGIDQSKRSTACVMLNGEGELLDYLLINIPGEDCTEITILQWFEFTRWLGENISSHEDIGGAYIEGLAFGAVSGSKDFLARLQGYFITRMEVEYGVRMGIVPVTAWRSKVLDKGEQRQAKASGKDGLKWAVYEKLPEIIRAQFFNYVEVFKDRINTAKDSKIRPGSKSLKYKEALFDLADAYSIAQFCLKLSTHR